MINQDAIVFMKICPHAGEGLDSIIERKMKEIRDTGMCFWGYGGTTCHPRRQVQPFAEKVVQDTGSIYLFMEKIKSSVAPDIAPATQYSIDGIDYSPIPQGIVVTGSKYAIVLDEIVCQPFEIPINRYGVAIGPSKGNLAPAYLKRGGKGCLALENSHSTETEMEKDKAATIFAVAKMKAPYAVFLK